MSVNHDPNHDHHEIPSDTALRVKALESLLVEKGLVDSAALDAIIDTYQNKVGPRNGANVVAKAWSDPGYKARLMEDATAAIAELGFTGTCGFQKGEHFPYYKFPPGRFLPDSGLGTPFYSRQFLR